VKNNEGLKVVSDARVDIELIREHGETAYRVICHPGDEFLVLKPELEMGSIGLCIPSEDVDAVVIALVRGKQILDKGLTNCIQKED
jgi:hypothetical protein